MERVSMIVVTRSMIFGVMVASVMHGIVVMGTTGPNAVVTEVPFWASLVVDAVAVGVVAVIGMFGIGIFGSES